MPRSPHAARSPAAPSRVPSPAPARPTTPRCRQNAATTGAAPASAPAPSSPPSAPRSCARPATPARCNNRAAAQPDPRARSPRQALPRTSQISTRSHSRPAASSQPPHVQREAQELLDSQSRLLRPSDSVGLAADGPRNAPVSGAIRPSAYCALRSSRSRQRAVDHGDGVVEPVDRRERAEARAFLLPEQHLIEHVEPFERHARLAILALDLSGAVEKRLAPSDLVHHLLNLLRRRVHRQLREPVAQVEQRRALALGRPAELLRGQHEVME